MEENELNPCIPAKPNTPTPPQEIENIEKEIEVLQERLGTLHDIQDAANARVEEPDIQKPKPWWKTLGPGLVTGASDNDPAGIGTYSVIGAQFGYSLLWTVLLSLPLMIAVQEMCGRVAVVTGKGVAAIVKQHYSKSLLYTCVILLIGVNIVNIYADLNIVSSSVQMLFHGAFWVWLTLLTLFLLISQIFLSYRVYVNLLKWLCLSFLAYVVTALLPNVHNSWPQIARHLFIPFWSWKLPFLMAIVGDLGTTISPYLFFWQAGQQIEELIAQDVADAPGKRKKPHNIHELHNMRSDTALGMLSSQVVTFFIILATAATLHAKGITNINTAQDAARALLPLGKAAYWLFTLGILGAGLLAIPTLAGSAAYALSEAMDWRHGLYRRFQRAQGFYGTIAAMILGGYMLNFFHLLTPVKALFYSSILNGVVAVPLLVVLMCICNNPAIMKERTNGKPINVLG